MSRSAISIPQSAERDVDMLFVIDNSGSMGGEIMSVEANINMMRTQDEM